MENQMKSTLSLLVGALLFMGCGGPSPEEAQGSQGAIAIPEQYLSPEDSSAEGGEVNALMACCYFRCSDNLLRGPFPNVVEGNCRNYAKYQCARRGLGFVGASWRDC
ncbi:hypothetical protein [Corallococcus macrosporus]|uniref:Putative lipoprotein n=1 Tax=Myxococcus fulvus (strain ATCC BAA-855 / HW-1) TaxID=483219 RepID=F8C8G3_MYXFH|nr:hypothetical protein [Corallococcus macrosporus]AEI62009.1 putative lipoprotein [Corallococcus macrosporus]